MKPTFDSMSADRYEFTHCRRPRGEGCWAFELSDGPRTCQIFLNCKYSKAKRTALVTAAEQGYTTVSVLP